MIHYHSGYKYQLAVEYNIELKGLNPPSLFVHDYFSITRTGYLHIRKGYAWDGPSGPTIDTKNFMRGSLVHDVLYQLIGLGALPYSDRLRADEILREICLEDGMSRIRAWWVYRGVRIGGSEPARKPEPPPDTAGKC